MNLMMKRMMLAAGAMLCLLVVAPGASAQFPPPCYGCDDTHWDNVHCYLIQAPGVGDTECAVDWTKCILGGNICEEIAWSPEGGAIRGDGTVRFASSVNPDGAAEFINGEGYGLDFEPSAESFLQLKNCKGLVTERRYAEREKEDLRRSSQVLVV